MYFLLNLILYISIFQKSNNNNDTLIISLSCNFNNLKNIDLIIKSISNQNVNPLLYKILLIISKEELKNKLLIPNTILSLINLNIISLITINKAINLQTNLIIAMNKYPNNPILIINHYTIFPDGWLKMFIEDHKKYPNDIISASIQYFFDKNLKIKQFEEGYNGKYFGVFNHIPGMIFNFAIVNTYLGGTLYPKNSFKNSYFFNTKMFLKISKNSDEFWQSCFLMIEQKILRQSSKIYDYTQYIILEKDIKLLKKKRKRKLTKYFRTFLKYFPNFNKIIEFRQNKILISLTSYEKRFFLLPSVINSLKNQISFENIKIMLFLFKKDMKKYNLTLNGINIITVNEDLKPHKKYYYAMNKYRDYAIITVDDDIIYSHDMLISLINSYLDHPNIVSGRRSHIMEYKKNGELGNYMSWIKEQKKIKEADFNIFLTGCGGIIYPPDIFQINERYLKIINETLTTDDITLKYFETIKGVEVIWVPNAYQQGLKTIIYNPLYKFNINNNEINLKKINIVIDNEILKNLCVKYKNTKTGLTIHLFNIYNIYNNSGIIKFSIDAYSYCPIDNKIKFSIYFDKIIAKCSFNYSYSIINDNIIYKTNKIMRASCFINSVNNIYLNNYLFPEAFSEDISNIKTYNYQIYQPIIFQNFYIKHMKYELKALFYKTLERDYNIIIRINNITFNCFLNENIKYLNNYIPIYNSFRCYKYNFTNANNIKIFDLSETFPKYEEFENKISNQFIISKIYYEIIERKCFIIIKGSFFKDLIFNLKNITINFLYPSLSLNCFVNKVNYYILGYIYCNLNKNLNINFSKILIKNQIVYSKNYNFILINKEILFQNYKIIKEIVDDNLFQEDYKSNKKIGSYYFLKYNYYFDIIFSFFFILIKNIWKIKNDSNNKK